jgi:hypothetical protein
MRDIPALPNVAIWAAKLGLLGMKPRRVRTGVSLERPKSRLDVETRKSFVDALGPSENVVGVSYSVLHVILEE